MGALIPQGLAGSPNYFGFLNSLVILINCESLKEIGEMACVTPAWSFHGQALKGELKPKIELISFDSQSDEILDLRRYLC